MIRGGSTLGLGRIDSGDAGRVDSGADRPVTTCRGNFITAPAEFRRCHFRFCDLFVQPKRTITKLNVAKIPQNVCP